MQRPMLRPYNPGQFQSLNQNGEFCHNLRAMESNGMTDDFHHDHEKLAGILASRGPAKISTVGCAPELLQRMVDMTVAENLACHDPNSPAGFRNAPGGCALCTRLGLGVVVATTTVDNDSASVQTRVPAADGSDTMIVTWDQSRFRHEWRSAADSDPHASPVEQVGVAQGDTVICCTPSISSCSGDLPMNQRRVQENSIGRIARA